MSTEHDTVRRFVASDGWRLYYLDEVWRDSIAYSLTDMTFDGGPEGPTSDVDGAPLWGTLDIVRPALRITWIDGSRKGEVVDVPLTAVPGLVSVGGEQVTGWRLAPGIAPPWVTEVLQYGLNEGPTLEGSRYIPDKIGDEVERGDDQPNLTFTVVFLPTDTAPVHVGKQEREETAASVQDFLSSPTL